MKGKNQSNSKSATPISGIKETRTTIQERIIPPDENEISERDLDFEIQKFSDSLYRCKVYSAADRGKAFLLELAPSQFSEIEIAKRFPSGGDFWVRVFDRNSGKVVFSDAFVSAMTNFQNPTLPMKAAPGTDLNSIIALMIQQMQNDHAEAKASYRMMSDYLLRSQQHFVELASRANQDNGLEKIERLAGILSNLKSSSESSSVLETVQLLDTLKEKMISENPKTGTGILDVLKSLIPLLATSRPISPEPTFLAQQIDPAKTGAEVKTNGSGPGELYFQSLLPTLTGLLENEEDKDFLCDSVSAILDANAHNPGLPHLLQFVFVDNSCDSLINRFGLSRHAEKFRMIYESLRQRIHPPATASIPVERGDERAQSDLASDEGAHKGKSN